MDLDRTVRQLDSLDSAVRQAALSRLLDAVAAGELPRPAEQQIVNLHCHTIFSYNGYGYSPSRLAWMARQQGWAMLGTIEFDVLDGLNETYAACDALGVRGSVGIETRVHLTDFPDWETNSPGEPGVMYAIGMGFTNAQPGGEAGRTLADLRQRADSRNRLMVAKLNDYLAPVTVDYDADVLTLTPAGNATERHMLVAYDIAARRHFPVRDDLLRFWAHKLAMPAEQVDALIGDVPMPHDMVRAKLMKQGGVGYMQPDETTFPSFEAVNTMILESGALPNHGFVDGLSKGETHTEELLEYTVAKGIACFNIVPDRNWNIADPELRDKKVKRLYEVLDTVRAMDLPIIIGTEMNKAGLKLIDDFDAPAMRPLRQDAMFGAWFLHGHTVLQRACGLGYGSAWAKSLLPQRGQRNRFYAELGQAVPAGAQGWTKLAALDANATPEQVLSVARP